MYFLTSLPTKQPLSLPSWHMDVWRSKLKLSAMNNNGLWMLILRLQKNSAGSARIEMFMQLTDKAIVLFEKSNWNNFWVAIQLKR